MGDGEIIIPAATVLKCPGRFDSDDRKNFALLGSSDPEAKSAIGFHGFCVPDAQLPANCHPQHDVDHYKRLWVSNAPIERAGDPAGSPSVPGCRANSHRVVCTRDWPTVMDPLRKFLCCTGAKTRPFDCEQNFCPGTQACNVIVATHCSKPENVESDACAGFCDTNPDTCRAAIIQRCRGNELRTPYCQTQCKRVNCVPALTEFYNLPENKADVVGSCFHNADFNTFKADLLSKNPAVRPQDVKIQCAFRACAVNEPSKSLLGPSLAANDQCPPNCIQFIKNNLGDGNRIDNIELINKCVINATNPGNDDDNDDDDDDPGRVPGETAAEKLLRLAEEAAARKRKRNIIIYSSVAAAVLLGVIILFLVIRSRRKKTAAAVAV